MMTRARLDIWTRSASSITASFGGPNAITAVSRCPKHGFFTRRPDAVGAAAPSLEHGDFETAPTDATFDERTSSRFLDGRMSTGDSLSSLDVARMKKTLMGGLALAVGFAGSYASLGPRLAKWANASKTSSASSGPPVRFTDPSGKIGFADPTGRVVVAAQYDRVGEPAER